MTTIYRNRYECYDDGRVFDLKRNCWSAQTVNGRYLEIYIEGMGSIGVHRVIWQAFNGPIPEKCHIHHISQNPKDNSLLNLECKDGHQHLHEHREGKVPNFEWTEQRTAKRLQTRKQNAIGNPNYGTSEHSGEKNGMYGKKHTDEWKKQHSADMSGEKNPNFGKKWTPEAIARRVAKYKQNRLKKLAQNQ